MFTNLNYFVRNINALVYDTNIKLSLIVRYIFITDETDGDVFKERGIFEIIEKRLFNSKTVLNMEIKVQFYSNKISNKWFKLWQVSFAFFLYCSVNTFDKIHPFFEPQNESWCSKREQCLLFTAGVRDSLNLIREKIAFVKDVALLDSLRKPFRDIFGMYVWYAETYSKTKVSTFMVVDDNRSDPLVTFTCEILSYIGKIMRFCENVLPFIKTTNNDMALGQYFNVIHSTCKYFEKVVVNN